MRSLKPSVLITINVDLDKASNVSRMKVSFCYIVYISVTLQSYDSHIFLETVITGNDALFKCTVPSFLGDFLNINGWFDSEGNQLGVGLGNSSMPVYFKT